MNTQITKTIIVGWLILATNSLQAWQTPLDPFSISPNASGVRSNQGQTDRVVQGGSILISWSENNDELRGFSNSLGEWEILKIDKQDSIIPIVSDGVSAVRVGDSIAAFSGVKGWWDVVALSKDSAAQPTVSGDLVQIEDNGHLYTFAAAKGRWTSPTDPEYQSASSEIDLPMSVQSDNKRKYDEWLLSMPRHRARAVSLMFHGGRLVRIESDRRSTRNLVEAKLKGLSAVSTSSAAVSSTNPESAVSDIENGIATMRQELQQLELAVHAASHTQDSPDKTRDDQQRELRKRVEQTFDLRQQLQRLEAQRMKIKLQLIEANLDSREKNREDIIQRRVNELLDSKGKLTGRDAGDKITSTTDPEIPVTGTLIDLPGPPHLPVDDPNGLVSHQVRNIDARIQWPQPAEIAKDLRGKMESVTRLLETRKEHQQSVERWSRPLEELQSKGIVDQKFTEAKRQGTVDVSSRRFASTQSMLDNLERDWNLAWSAYQSKLRLLRLDLDEAKLALESLTSELNRMQQLHERGEIPTSDVQKTESGLAVARINVQRAEEMLKLYADIEIQEPALNPESPRSEKQRAAEVPFQGNAVKDFDQ